MKLIATLTAMMVLGGIHGGATVASSPAGRNAPFCSVPSNDVASRIKISGMPSGVRVEWTGENDATFTASFRSTSAGVVFDVGQSGRMLIAEGTPVLAVKGGLRRLTGQQLEPLETLKTNVDQQTVDRYKWDAFWDSPLNIPGGKGHLTATPPVAGVAGQKGMPRTSSEIFEGQLAFDQISCDVTRERGRALVSFGGARAGPFAGRLEFAIFEGSSLVRQTFVGRTQSPSVAYKYDMGFSQAVSSATRLTWRSNAGGEITTMSATGSPSPEVARLRTANRLVALTDDAGGVAVLPPPHRFFWARENEHNIGFNWYRRENDGSVAIGVGAPDREDPPGYSGHGDEDVSENYALYSARPGSWQKMSMFIYLSPHGGTTALDGARAYTRDDRFAVLPGYKVMATHFHTALAHRLEQRGSHSASLADLDLAKATGIDIFAPIDGPDQSGVVETGTAGPFRPKDDRALDGLDRYYDAAARQSDDRFLVMPNWEELSGKLGGHTDVIFSHPTWYVPARAAGEPLIIKDAKRGSIWRLGGPEDVLAMANQEHALFFEPHPRSKGSTGYPDSIRDTPWFRSPSYAGIGMRWGMGLDLSETRLCEYRCQSTLDDMNNWITGSGLPAKKALAITETYYKSPGDDIYANNPVNYVHIDQVPTGRDWTKIVDALASGDFFWTSGEVLLPKVTFDRKGSGRIVVSADASWTFPLDFVEVVWGDGQRVRRKIARTTDALPFGSSRYRIEVPMKRGWVRFAAWDVAGNGAMSQPKFVEQIK